MGVISPYKTFTFDGKSSADYGVYLTGEGVFNAPERSVEMVEIPGRNGNFALDKGRFENISVTYRVGMFDDDEANFADKVSAFRNWLCSKVGYVRLSDDYNPNEYRLAVYLSGLELEHDFLIAGEAQITFDCKPQRWLTSGETAVSVADGGTLDNPTLFESEPLLAVKGYGNISFNGYSIDIENAVLGDVVVADGDSFTTDKTYTLDESVVNIGDEISVNVRFESTANVQAKSIKTTMNMSTQSSSDTDSSFTTQTPNFTKKTYSSGAQGFTSAFITNVDTITFTVGTSTAITNTATISISGTTSGQVPIGTYSCTYTMTQHITYYASSGTIRIRIVYSSTTDNNNTHASIGTCSGKGVNVTMHSTKSIIADTNYIDCEIGECYFFSGGEAVSSNNIISLGSDLPKLVSGTNTFNYDNTITNFTVTPRWWKV